MINANMIKIGVGATMLITGLAVGIKEYIDYKRLGDQAVDSMNELAYLNNFNKQFKTKEKEYKGKNYREFLEEELNKAKEHYKALEANFVYATNDELKKAMISNAAYEMEMIEKIEKMIEEL